MGRDSAIGIAISYGMDGTRIVSPWGAFFSAPFLVDPGAHPAYYAMGTRSFPGIKRLGRDVEHPLPSSAEVKEIVDLYINTTSGSS